MVSSGSPSALRRGLPRVAGGDAWPPAGIVPAGATPAPETGEVVDATATVAATPALASADGAASVSPAPVASAAEPTVDASAPAVTAAAASPAAPATAAVSTPLRRGLPRTRGGEAWPPASAVAATTASPAAPAATAAAAAATPTEVAAAVPAAVSGAATGATAAGHAVAAAAASTAGEPLRRGLPRTTGGDPWPPAGAARAAAPVAAPLASAQTAAPVASAQTAAPVADAPAAAAVSVEASTPAAAVASTPVASTAPTSTAVATADEARAPLTVPRTVWPGRAASHRPTPEPKPKRIGPFTKGQWAGVVIVGGLGLLLAAGMAVALVRFLLSLDAMQDFLATYPGEYHLPEGAPVGIPAWLGWQHFFNVFLMVLIIRSGLTIRNEKRPAVFWAPKNDPKGKTSLTIWFHQALDIFWILNGVVFVVLLFVTGQWMRIVPTSWEVFPNALSAALQYVSLDWPTENGWVNYNALQQLAYFSTVFLAAPLAIVTGVRMSSLWPKKAERLSRAYPIEWARKVHFPTMLYFVVFIIIHVALVLATGALRNLNHMYAAQGSTDPTAYADNWTGFWMFVLSLVVIAAAWVAARPLVLAPIARLFGTVSGR
ncbi:cytochrome b/b6 domain-containing protein [Microbacterium lacticum]